jgi:hypothetical protein
MITKERKLEILDKTIAHFRQQGTYAFQGGNCKYRTSKGHKCAVGAWIPDKLYRPEMEGVNVYTVARYNLTSFEIAGQTAVQTALAASGISGPELPFMKTLQELHDTAAYDKLPFDEFLLDLGLLRNRIAAEATPPTP